LRGVPKGSAGNVFMHSAGVAFSVLPTLFRSFWNQRFGWVSETVTELRWV